MPGPYRFQTPAQRSVSLGQQARYEAQKQVTQQRRENERLQREFRLEQQRQRLLEQQENKRVSDEFRVEQQRQRDLEKRESFRDEFGVEQSRQRMLDRQRAPRPSVTPTPEPFEFPQVPAAISEGVAGVAANRPIIRRMIEASGINLTADEEERLLRFPPDVVRAHIEAGNIGPLVDVGAPGSLSPLQGVPFLGTATQPEATFPGVAGKIPFLRTPGEAATTIGTAGLGSIPVSSKVFGLLGGIGGATGGGQLAPEVGLPPVAGELAGGLAGGLGGSLAGPGITQRAGVLGREAVAGARAQPEAGAARLGREARPIADQINQITKELASSEVQPLLRKLIPDLTDDELRRLYLHAESWLTSGSAKVHRDGDRLITQLFDEAKRRGVPPPNRPSTTIRQPSTRAFPEEIAPARVGEELRGFEPPRGPPRKPPIPPEKPPIEPPGPPPEDPVVKLTRVIKEAKPVRGQTLRLQRQELQRKAGAVAGALERSTGEEAFIRARAAQRGELPSIQFEGVREQFSSEELNNLFELVRTSDKSVFAGKPFTRVNAGQTLFKVMNGELPTRGEIKLMEEVFGRELAGELEKFRPFNERAWRGFVDVVNLPRTLMASVDFSFPLRQGVMVGTRHPREFFGNLPKMFKGGFSAKQAQLVDDAIRTDNTLIQIGDEAVTVAELAETHGLYRGTLRDFGELAEREEFFISRLARKIPVVGQAVRVSERAFVTYGNKLRHDIFRQTLQNWGRGRKAITDNEVQGLADLLNKLTGRGSLGPANRLAPFLSGSFFAPRFAVSRPQAFLMMFHPQARVRQAAVQEIVTFVGAGMSVLALADLSGLGVELDPRSTDFGKIRFGNSRFDFWGGNVQWARLVGQMITGQRKGGDGLIIPTDRRELGLRFLRTKLAPATAVLADSPIFAGENLIGEEFPTDPLGIADEVRKRLVPLAIQDLAEAIEQEGAMGGFGAVAFGGVGVQTYESESERRARRFEEKFNRPFSGSTEDYILMRDDQEMNQEFPVSGKAKEDADFLEETANSLALPEMAKSIEQGNLQAGSRFVEAVEDYLSIVSAVAARKRFGQSQSASPEYLRWRDIRPNDSKYRDPATFEIDWDSYFSDKETAFAALDPQLRTALRSLDIPGVPAGVIADYQKVREVRKQFFDEPKYRGLSLQEEDELEELRDAAENIQRESVNRIGQPIDTGLAILRAAREIGASAKVRRFALNFRHRRLEQLRRRPERDQILLDNQILFATFFPDLLERELSRAEEAELEQPAFEAIAR